MLTQKAIHLDNKKIYHILAISGIFLLLVAFLFNYKCIFKSIFHIDCISCGLTRGFKSILNLNFIEATRYNILSIPLFILVIVYYILYLFNNRLLDKIYSYIIKNYNVCLIILLISWIINIVK